MNCRLHGCTIEIIGKYGLCEQHEQAIFDQALPRIVSEFYCQAENCVTRIKKDDIWCKAHFRCSFTGCTATVKYAKGLCAVHYQQTKYVKVPRQVLNRCMAEHCKQTQWRGRRKLEDSKEWEVRFVYDDDKQYCSVHRPKNVMPTEVFPKEWQE